MRFIKKTTQFWTIGITDYPVSVRIGSDNNQSKKVAYNAVIL